ncbi:hypothetical protein ACHHV8_11015 [Paenibacillus sp. TAB 01]|uniref:hypothetical protein n=1 Tax=Paenibacillus sp. TAB 01 TaxID=3368988 RepID=UPI0037509691
MINNFGAFNRKNENTNMSLIYFRDTKQKAIKAKNEISKINKAIENHDMTIAPSIWALEPVGSNILFEQFVQRLPKGFLIIMPNPSHIGSLKNVRELIKKDACILFSDYGMEVVHSFSFYKVCKGYLKSVGVTEFNNIQVSNFFHNISWQVKDRTSDKEGTIACKF